MSQTYWPYAIDADEAPPLDADRLILWLARRQWRTILGGVLFGVPWMLSIALVPAAMGKAIDGPRGPRRRALLLWCGVLVGLGVVSAWPAPGGTGSPSELAARGVPLRLITSARRRAGPALTRRMPTGDVVAVFANDFADRRPLRRLRAVRRRDRQLRRRRAHPAQRLDAARPVVLIGVPVLVASLAFIVRPLQSARPPSARSPAGSSGSAPTPSPGLRVLRGIGGEQTFLRRYADQSRRSGAGVRVAGIQAALDAAQVLLPGIFVVVVMARRAFAIAGDITPASSSRSTATPPSSSCPCARRPSSSTG